MNAPPSSARHRGEGRSLTLARGGSARSLVLAVAVLGAATVLAIGGAGSFALWSGTAAADGATVSSGTAGLTVNGAQNATISGLNASLLAPGTSTVTTLTLTNTGTVPLTTALTQTTISQQTHGLGSTVRVRMTPVATSAACTAGLTGASGPLAGFTTSPSAPLAPAASALYCLELGLPLDAPASVQSGTAAFTLTFTATQVAP